MTRAVREAKKYAGFREAFGMTIDHFPLMKENIARLENVARRTTAGAFKLYRDFLALEGGLKAGLVADEPDDVRKRRFEVRELIMLQKITAAWDSTEVLHEAMSVFGGHGVMEDFSSLPRLYRDSAVNELWEGPRNVLLTQIFRDIKKVTGWYAPSELVRNILKGLNVEAADKLALEITDIMALPDSDIGMWRRWDIFCADFFHACQNLALHEVERTAKEARRE